MSGTSENNKRIAKNTLLLYFRMMLIIIITLYTSRVILNTLGVEDYGIYNVVGGVITMLGFLNGSLGGASSRFITFALGKGDKNELQNVFSTVLCVHFLLAGIIVLLAETVGLWFVCNKLVIPAERMTAALWVYHCAILTMVVTIISVPYNALIIAYERMDAFAYISILEVVLKLVIVWMLVYIPADKLIVYALLYLVVQFIIRMSYSRYCSTHFREIKPKLQWNIPLMKKISTYAGWTVNGNLAVMGYTQGINILLNLFFGPAVNAARGVAVQVQTAIMSFVQNFQMAVRPQIIKSFATNDLAYMHKLIIASSKYGFFLLLLLAFPIMFGIDAILKIWLGIVPEHTANFVRIMLFVGMIEPLSVSLINAIHATGDIKKFQIYEGSVLLSIVPIAYVLLKVYHITPEAVMWVYFGVVLITQGIRIWIVLPKVSMKYSVYIQRVIGPLLLPLGCFLLPFEFLSIQEDISFGMLVFYAFLGVLYMAICVFLMGTTISEKGYLMNFIKDKVSYEKNKS